jgi:hypothetical protein
VWGRCYYSGKTGWVKGATRKAADKVSEKTDYKYTSLFKQLQIAG